MYGFIRLNEDPDPALSTVIPVVAELFVAVAAWLVAVAAWLVAVAFWLVAVAAPVFSAVELVSEVPTRFVPAPVAVVVDAWVWE